MPDDHRKVWDSIHILTWNPGPTGQVMIMMEPLHPDDPGLDRVWMYISEDLHQRMIGGGKMSS